MVQAHVSIGALSLTLQVTQPPKMYKQCLNFTFTTYLVVHKLVGKQLIGL